MQKLITKYGLAAHLAFLAVAPLFLSPIPLLWVSALVAVWVIVEPSRIGNEMLHGARDRVASGLVRDPLFWILLALIVVSGVRALNGGVATVYDAELGTWTIASPQWPILPGTVCGESAVMHFATSVSLCVVVMGCRHALGRSARFACALAAGGFVGLIYLARVLMSCTDISVFAKTAVVSSETPIYQGMAFGTLLLLSLTSLVTVFERRWWKALPFQILGIVGAAFTTFLYSPAYMSALWSIGLVIIAFYAFLYLRFVVGKLADFKYLVVIGVSLTIAGMLAMIVLTPDQMDLRIAPFLSHDGFLSRTFLNSREALSRISLAIWKDHPWLGTGLSSFALDLNFHAAETDWRVISPLQTAPLNGFWLLLVERGVVGAFFVLVPLALLVISYVNRFIGALRTFPHPLAILAPVLLVVTVLTLLLDCSAFAPAAFLLIFAVITLSANSFAKKEERNGR